jgi:hypothetical protein
MSKFNYGMGKTYSSASEAFRDANYANAIEFPKNEEYSVFWSLLGVLLFVGIFGYGFWITINA